jgi:hypothetical protein
MNTYSPTIRLVFAPLLVLGLLVGTLPARDIVACDADSAGCCCCPSAQLASCTMACCQTPTPVPDRLPYDPEKRSPRNSSDGKLGWVNSAVGHNAPASMPVDQADLMAAPRDRGPSLIAQHVRLQI